MEKYVTEPEALKNYRNSLKALERRHKKLAGRCYRFSGDEKGGEIEKL
jgi:hypothetical protein